MFTSILINGEHKHTFLVAHIAQDLADDLTNGLQRLEVVLALLVILLKGHLLLPHCICISIDARENRLITVADDL